MPALLERFDATLHAVLSHLVSLGEDEASGEVAMAAHHLSRDGEGDGAEDFVLHGRYLDRYARGEDGRWRFAARRLEVAWTERRRARLP